jgi:glycosyltransferase involved in cell wall biosynthesis
MPDTQKPAVAFIIPARNEAEMLPSTLDSIGRHAAVIGGYEVIVVDNLSTDGTGGIAAGKGARVITSNAGTIAASRNLGVRNSHADIFIFLDADVTLTREWSLAAPDILDNVARNPFLLSGSDCRIGDSAGWVTRTWFDAPGLKTSGLYIGSAHLIISRILFERLGGFDETLKTGEDYDICSRARTIGAQLVKAPALKVIHHGVPRSAIEFLRREMWHGLGDTQSIKSISRSKVALTALAFTALHMAALLFLLLPSPGHYLSLTALLFIVIICLASAVKKFGSNNPLTLLKTAFLFYLYYCGRSLSIFSSLAPGLNISGPRAGRSQHSSKNV